jgi:hypothetical protein
MAAMAGKGPSVGSNGGVAPGDGAGAGFGAVMQHALSQVPGAGEGGGQGAQAPMAGDGKGAAGSAAAGGDAQANPKNVVDTVTNAERGNRAGSAVKPGAQAESGTATAAKTVEALAGGVQAMAQPTLATAERNVTDEGTNVVKTVSAGADATGGAVGPAKGAAGEASAKDGKKTEVKKTADKSQPVPPGLLVNGAGMLATAVSAAAAHPAAVTAGTVAAVKTTRDGRPGAVAVVPGRAALAAGGVASKGAAAAGAGMQAAGTSAANVGKQVPGVVAVQAHGENHAQGNLVAATGGVGSAASSAQTAVGADTGSGSGLSSGSGAGPDAGLDAGNGNAVHSQSGNAAGGSGLTASHARDGAKNAGGGNGSASGGFTATLLQAHVGNELGSGSANGTGNGSGNGFGSGLGVSAGAGAGAAAGVHGSVPHAAGSAGGMGVANPYARMDEPQRATLVHASPQKMSVAVSDSGLGNFQVRAQGAGAQVAASLATSSAVTHAQLSGHLPALTAFLQDQRVDVSHVTVVQQSLLGGDAGPREFGGHERQGSSGGRGAQAQAGRVGSVGAAGLKGTVGSGGPVGAAAGMDTGFVDAAGASAQRAAEMDGKAMSTVDVHA